MSNDLTTYEVSQRLGEESGLSAYEDPHMATIRFETAKHILAERIGDLINRIEHAANQEEDEILGGAIRDLYRMSHSLRIEDVDKIQAIFDEHASYRAARER